ncbi:MAG: MBG domain-containing protein [Paludibacteraceae bacterium]|nr:MBG domain-containing protein [Paludibacteraceae bacterium]
METKNLLNKKITQWLLLVAMLVGCSANALADHTFVSGEYIYLKNYKPTNWGSCWICDGGVAWIHIWDASGNAEDCKFSLYSGTKETEGAIYRAKITNARTYTKMELTRNSSASTGPYNNKWNQTGNMTVHSTNNMITKADENATSYSSSYCVATPASCSITLASSCYKSGSGTSSDPYIVTAGATLSFTVSATKDDPGMTGFGWNINSSSSKASSGTSTSWTTTKTASSTADKTETWVGYAWNYKSSTSYYSSSSAKSSTIYTKTVPACTTPTASNFNVSGLTGKTYNGSEQAPTITAASGMGTMTVKYDGTAGTGKTNAGTYAITVDVAAGTTYCAATGIELGDFVINKATHPAISVNDQSVCANQSITLSISGAMETSNVTYSINSTGTTGTGTISGSTLNVTTPGIFKINATKAASTNYKEVSTTSPGTITVTPVITWKNYQPNATLDFGSVPIETTSDAITVNFTACNVSNFNASTTSAYFAVTNGTASGTGDKSFNVTFTPVAKTTYNGTVSVTWTGGSATFNLTGIGTKDCTPPTKDGYNYTLSDVVYDGSAKPVTVTAKSGYGTPTSVKYNGDTNAPSAVGAYTVSIVVPEYGDYCATTIGLGSFNITCPALTTSYGLLITKSSMCAGDAAATITLSGSQPSNRASYQLYKGDTPVGGSVAGTGNAITFSNITESGTYKVKALSTVTGCSSTQQFIDNTTSLTVNPLPSLTTTPSGSAVTAYLWEPVNLTATTTDGTATVAISTTSTKYEVTDITNGKSLKAGKENDTFSVTYTATSSNGCQTQEVKTVTAAKATEDCSK